MQGLQNEFSERVAAVRKIETELKSLAEKQQKDALLMTDDQKTELSRQLESLNADYQLKGKALQEDMKKRQAEEQQKLLIKVDTAIKAVAASGEYDVILQRQAAVFVKESADISAKVVEEVSKGN